MEVGLLTRHGPEKTTEKFSNYAYGSYPEYDTTSRDMEATNVKEIMDFLIRMIKTNTV